MTRAHDNLGDALRAVEAGDLDALTPEQVARLEAVLNREPRVAAELGDAIPPLDAGLAASLRDLEAPALPSARKWEEVWQGIELRTGGGVARERGLAPRILRFWKPLAAAAACLVLAGLWWGTTPPADPWPMRLATDVEIDDFQVYDDAMPFVVTTGGDSGVKLLWVLETEG